MRLIRKRRRPLSEEGGIVVNTAVIPKDFQLHYRHLHAPFLTVERLGATAEHNGNGYHVVARGEAVEAHLRLAIVDVHQCPGLVLDRLA